MPGTFTVPAQFSYTVEDELGVSATFLANAMVDPTATVTELDGIWQTLGGLLDAIIGGVIRGGHYRVMHDSVTGAKSDPAAGSRVEQSGVFNFSVDGTAYKTALMVPSIKDGVIAADRITLDGGVAAFLAAVVGATVGVLTWTSENRQELIALVDAFLSFRKHRRALSRVSFETP